MRERLELLVNLWTFGVPVVLIVWATLRLMPAAPARLVKRSLARERVSSCSVP